MMKTAKQKQIMLNVIELLKQADKDFLKRIDDKKKLVEELSNELLFLGTFTRQDLKRYVIPFLNKNVEYLYSKKEDILNGRKLNEELEDDICDYIELIEGLGKQIKEWRVKKNYSQKALASKAGTTQQVLSRIEKGKDLKQPTLETYHKIIKAAGLKLVCNVIAATNKNKKKKKPALRS